MSREIDNKEFWDLFTSNFAILELEQNLDCVVLGDNFQEEEANLLSLS